MRRTDDSSVRFGACVCVVQDNRIVDGRHAMPGEARRPRMKRNEMVTAGLGLGVTHGARPLLISPAPIAHRLTHRQPSLPTHRLRRPEPDGRERRRRPRSLPWCVAPPLPFTASTHSRTDSESSSSSLLLPSLPPPTRVLPIVLTHPPTHLALSIPSQQTGTDTWALLWAWGCWGRSCRTPPTALSLNTRRTKGGTGAGSIDG